MSSIRIKRGTRAQITTAAAANALRAGELYFVTDESRVDVGVSTSASEKLAKLSEAGAPPPVDSMSITYNGDGTVATVTEDGVTKTMTYNSDGTINTIAWPVGSLTRTETYTYTGDVLTGMTAAEA